MCLLWGIILGPGNLMSPFPKYVFLMGKFSFKNTAVAKEGHLSIYLIFKHPFSMYSAYWPERLSLLFGIFSQRTLLEVNLLDKPVSLCASSSLLNSQYTSCSLINISFYNFFNEKASHSAGQRHCNVKNIS